MERNLKRVGSRRAVTGVTAALVAACVVAPTARADGLVRPAERADHMAQHAALERLGAARARTPEGRRELRSAAAFRRLDRVRPLRRTPRARVAVAGPPAEIGSWGAPFQLPTPAVHTIQLPTGKVLFFGERAIRDNTSQAWLFDPSNGALKRVDPPAIRHPKTGVTAPANIFCGGQSLLPDGRVLVTGGTLEYQLTARTRHTGLDTVFTFNPYNETWTRQPDMRDGRFYPTQTLLPNGETVILGGSVSDPNRPKNDYINQDVEIFTPSPDLDGVGSIRRVTADSGVETPDKDWYPHTKVLASGRAALTGPLLDMSWYLNGAGASTYSWSDAPSPSRVREWSTAVPMPSGHTGPTRVMQIGGAAYGASAGPGRQAVASAETFDETSNSWAPAGSMNIRRGHHNTVLLPDGSMVTIGGGIGKVDSSEFPYREEQKTPELWDPASRQWRLGPEHTEVRSYHSTAVLLPDGRVFSAGDNGNGSKLSDVGEIYEPPYLHRGARPSISGAPSAVRHGAPFTLETPNADVTRAVLVAPGATTHANDVSQRHLTLPTTRRSDGRGVDVVAPTGPNAAPPGHYMLFAVNAAGVPSVARWVRIGADAPASAVLAPVGAAAPRPAAPPSTSPSRSGTRSRRRVGGATLVGRAPALRRGLARGLRMRVSCRRACTTRVRLYASKRDARRLRLERRQVAVGTVVLRGRGRKFVQVRFTRDARRRLRRARALILTVRTETRPKRGRRTVAYRTIRLRR